MAEAMNTTKTADYDAIVVGGGFAGIYMVHRLRNLMGMSVRAYEAGSGIGGTWFWNRYPGARCDIQSMEYSYQFSEELQQEWEWSERFATQPEILKYANHVAERFDLMKDIQLNTPVASTIYDDATSLWTVTTATGEVKTARFVVMATGCLSSANLPDIKGRDSFKGATYHTGKWPHEGVDFTGKRVAVIGTGSSAIQSIPLIAQQAKHLTVFQRTASFTVPAHNQPLDPEFVRDFKSRYKEIRTHNWQQPFGQDFGSFGESALKLSEAERTDIYEKQWQKGGLSFMGTFDDLMFDRAANETAAEFIRNKIRGIVKDPAVADALAPRQIVGCKRLCVDTGFYDTFNRDNVTLVPLDNNPLEEITTTGVRTGKGLVEVDAIVFATGFDAMTGAVSKIDVRGTGGRTLQDKWSEGPKTYLGLATAGFPNLFFVTGPGSPSVLSNMLPSIEQHVEWISDCIEHVSSHQGRTIEALPESEETWVHHVNDVAHTTLYPNCNSWYLGANVAGKVRVFMPYIGVNTYVDKCNDVVAKGYEGFRIAR